MPDYVQVKEPRSKTFAPAKYALDRIFSNSTESLGSWTLLSYQAFLKALPSRIRKIFEIDEESRQLRLEDFEYDVPDHINSYGFVASVKDADGDLTIPLKAKFALYDNGKLLERTSPRLVARIPFPTRDGNFVLGGTEFAIRKQLRLCPGVYASKREDGRIHAMLNTLKRQSADIYFDPDTSRFHYYVGNRQFPLYAVMKFAGVTDSRMRRAWGDELYQINSIDEKRMNGLASKLYSTMHNGRQPASYEAAIEGIQKAFEESKFDPWVNNVTLGKPYESINPELLLRASRKMLAVSAGKDEGDNREALYFKQPFDIGMMVNYAMDKASPRIQYKLRTRLKNRDDLTSIIAKPLGDLNKVLISKYNQDELSHTPDQYNPLGMILDNNEVTLMGEGGLRSRHQITEEARGVHDSTIGFIDGLYSPEGKHLGVNMELATRAHLAGRNLFTSNLVDRNGQKWIMTPRDLYNKTVALPGQVDFENGKPVLGKRMVHAVKNGNIQSVPADEIDVVMAGNPSENFGVASLVPFLGYNAGNRISTTIKKMAQAVPLVNPEAPLVRPLDSTGGTIGHFFYRRMNPAVPRHIKSGTVTMVRKDVIYIRDDKGETHKIPIRNDYQLNGDASITDKPIVKTGDKVKAGQVVAENQWSKDGEMALGTNLDVAFMPFYGYNHQDGLVISETAARKLASTHSYQHQFSNGRGDVYNKKKYLAYYPNKYRKEQLEKLDDDGVVTPGTILLPGDPMALKLSQQEVSEDDIVRGRIATIFKRPLRNDDKAWDGDYPAIVKRVIKNRDSVKVIVGTEEPATIGDKLTGMYGQRGVITLVLPDDQMPRYQDGAIPDILQNPAAVPSRMNAGQILESAASRIAQKTGFPYLVNNFKDNINTKTLRKELLSHGLAIEDPEGEIDTRRKVILPNGKEVAVFGGPQYFMKLKQLAAKYYGARGRRDSYDIISRKPVKGAKVDPLGLYALLSHGAVANLQEMGGFKSELNDETWRRFETGEALPAPKTTFAMDKLINLLKGAGINVDEEGDSYRLAPLTDAHVDQLSSGEVPDPTKGVNININKPVPLATFKGGLYDQNLFGGLNGDKYGHITLATPIPNPVFETPVKTILDLTGKQYESLIRGDTGVLNGEIVNIDKNNADQVATHGDAFRQLLSRIDVPTELTDLGRRYESAKGSAKDHIAKKMKYLNGLKQAGLNPTDYIISRIPVLPPMYRPIYLTKKNDLRVSDITTLYQNVGLINQSAKESRGILPELESQSFLDLYNAVKELQVIGKSSGYQNRHATGILEYLKGSNPKSGHFMSNILSKRQAISGYGTIMPDPKLDIDEIKIPEEMAWTMMEPFVMRKMVQAGVRPLDAEKMIAERNNMASNMLDTVLEERPVILSRDPKLHKHNYLAFQAKRNPGKAIYIPSLVCRGFNADFDGDRMVVNVPVGPDALKEAREKLMPSRNLFQAGRDRVIMQPEEEAIAGLYAATRIRRKLDAKFDKPSDIIKSYLEGNLNLDDGVMLGKIVTTPGRVFVNDKLPAEYRDYGMEFTAGNVQNLSKKLATDKPDMAGKYIQEIKQAGDMFATDIGLSFRMREFDPVEDKQELMNLIAKGRTSMTEAEKNKIHAKLRKHLPEDSVLALMADSGAKGKWDNIMQLLYSPVSVSLTTGKIDPNVMKRGYAEGLDYRDYITAIKGARSGLMSGKVEITEPGEFSKELVRNSLGMLVQPGDREEVEGLEYPVTAPTNLNRYLAADVKTKSGKVLAEAGTPITPELVQTAQKNRINTFIVRSPLTSRADDGIYAKDFGRLPGDKKPMPGTDIGVISAHSLTEPATQLALKSFHAAGATGQKNLVGFKPVWSLLRGHAPAGYEARLAPINGEITAIKTLPSGTHQIMIGDHKIQTSSPMKLNVKVGDKVKRGDQIQEGFPDPKAVLRFRGLRPLQMYLVNEIEHNYGGSAPDRRYIEAIVANCTKYAKVNISGDSDYSPGDIVPANHLEAFNLENTAARKAFNPVTYEPIFLGIGRSAAKAQSDWASSLLFGDIGRQLPDMAASGAQSAATGTQPIMPFIQSRTFGENIEEGRY